MVPRRPCLFSPPASLPYHHRAETGQVYARRCRADEPLSELRSRALDAPGNPPIGLILCSEHDTAVAHYALGNLGNQVLAREYQLTLPTEEQLTRRLQARRRQ